MNIDCILKISQILFFVIASTVAIMTYLKAKKGLLNTINTEYQKKALVKVEEISDYLISEFDKDSANYWVKQRIVEDIVKTMVESIALKGNSKQKDKKWHGGIPVDPTIERFSNWVKKVKSDPFVPRAIREIVIEYLEDRLSKMHSIHIEELRKFGEVLIKDPSKYIENKDIGHIIHNKIVQRQYDSGCGVSQVEEKVHELRLKIQKYYEKYDPFN